MQNRKRTVFLFGAGSALIWNSPLSSELTDLVRNNGFKTVDNKTYITEFIYQKLLSAGFDESEINFETIINSIEELLVYNSQFNDSKNTPSIIKALFETKFDDEIFNFSVKGGQAVHNYQLEIPKGVEYDFARYSQHNETPKQFFLQHLLVELISAINNRISKYSYHTPSHTVINTESSESRLFVKWIETFRNSSLRLYTLNYDRVFKILLERNGISIFEGFDCGEFVGYSTELRANVKRIMTDYESHVHYNLHGSAFWKTKSLDKEQLPNPEFVLTGGPSLPVNSDHISFQVEKGKAILPTNIITGYQKAQRTLLTPFKQMQAAFDRDCCFADEIFIVGYSLGDEHINESIKTAIRHNPTVKISIVDPFFLKNELDFQMAIKLFPFMNEGVMKATTITPNRLHIFFNGRFELHTIDFRTFLEDVSNPLSRTRMWQRSAT